MQLNHFLQIILDEIAAEGLEGTTLECLWEYLLSFNYFKFIDELYKEYLWKFIRNFTKVNFYLLEEARDCNFQNQNRDSQYNFDKECFLETNIPMFQIHQYHNLPTVFGSCTSYNSRILIDDEIKNNDNCTYRNVMEKYGNKLIIVATEKYRLEFLGLKEIEKCLEKPTFALLELIGRSRYHGIKSIGKFSCLEYFKNPSNLWYLKKKLKLQCLLRVQKVNFLQNGSVREVIVLQLNRFYKPLYNVFEQNMQKMLLFMTSIRSVALLKSTFLEILELPEDFLNKAKQTRWVEIITTTYRKLNQSCDMDEHYTDRELLDFYIEDFRLPEHNHAPLSLIDTSGCYIKPIRTLYNLIERVDMMVVMFENDNEPAPDVSLSIRDFEVNIEEPLHIQVLKLLAKQPMNPQEIKSAFNINKTVLRALLKMLKKNGEVVMNYRSMDRNNVPYFTINQKLVPQSNLIVDDGNIKQPPQEPGEDSSRLTLTKYINPLEVTIMNRNPKRQERYDFLVELVQNHVIITGHYIAQKFIREWEASRNMKEVMDRKSFLRILDEAVKNRTIKVIDVDFTVYEKVITEKWLVKPGLSRDDQIFQDKVREHQNELSTKKMDSKIKISVKTSPKKKKRKSSCKLKNSPQNINVIKMVKNIPYEDNIIDFKFPELPAMLRRKIFHEFIWYLSIGSHQESNINIQEKVDEDHFRIYLDVIDWRRHVAPLQEDISEEFFTFNLDDIISRLPLCLFCILAVPRYCNQELYDCLINEKLRWATLENLTNSHLALVSFILNHKKRFGIRRIVELLESLIDMGLITKRHQSNTIIFKEDVSCIWFMNFIINPVYYHY